MTGAAYPGGDELGVGVSQHAANHAPHRLVRCCRAVQRFCTSAEASHTRVSERRPKHAAVARRLTLIIWKFPHWGVSQHMLPVTLSTTATHPPGAPRRKCRADLPRHCF